MAGYFERKVGTNCVSLVHCVMLAFLLPTSSHHTEVPRPFLPFERYSEELGGGTGSKHLHLHLTKDQVFKEQCTKNRP